MANDETTAAIRAEIVRALESLDADHSLLATVSSWGDTLTDEEVLRLLREHNQSK